MNINRTSIKEFCFQDDFNHVLILDNIYGGLVRNSPQIFPFLLPICKSKYSLDYLNFLSI